MSEEYSPYCPICNACGVEGCCSPMACQQYPNGSYCQTYLQDLKHAYLMNTWWYENVYDTLSPELKEQCDAEFDKAYDHCYKELGSSE
jgi:hypothetical protein